MAAVPWKIILSHRYSYGVDPATFPFLSGIVGGFVVGAVLIWLIFQHGVEESRLGLWLTGCVVSGLAAGVFIYRTLLPLGSCWAWFGC